MQFARATDLIEIEFLSKRIQTELLFLLPSPRLTYKFT